MEFTRRDFGKIAMAAAPVAAGLSIPALSKAAQSSIIDGVQIGAITYSFRQGVDKTTLPAVMQKLGLSEVELMSGDAEIIAGIPSAGGGGGFGGGPGGGGGRGRSGGGGRGGGRGGSGGGAEAAAVARAGAAVALAPNGCPVNSPSGQDSMAKSGQAPARGGGAGGSGRGGGGRGGGALTPEQEAAQKAVADWRMAANASTWKGVRKKFNDAGVDLQILCYNMGANIKDDEIDYAFQMARDMGVRAISCSATVPTARRVAPFADKYKIMWGGHGHADVFDDQQFARPETFREIMTFSKYIGVNLDIGHFTAAGFDAVTFIPEVHDRITNIHLKDRTKPDQCYNSGNLPWGQGQTPIKEVLLLMKKNKYKFPANIELEYSIQGSDAVTEVGKCYDFIKKCFA